MKTKIRLPFGLALVVFIGVFTTMLRPRNPDPSVGAGSGRCPVDGSHRAQRRIWFREEKVSATFRP